MRVIVGVWVGWVILLVMALHPVLAQPVTPADSKAIRAVVEQQLDAFRQDDAAAAFSFASPSIQKKFGTPETFIRMVRTAYPSVYRPQHVVFQKLRVTRGTIVQPVLLVGPDNVPITALYPMHQRRDGVWKIDGCYLQPLASKAM